MSESWSIRLEPEARKAVNDLMSKWGLNRTDTLRRLVNLGFQHLAENEGMSVSDALASLAEDMNGLREVAQRQESDTRELHQGIANAMEILLLATKAFGDPADPEQRDQVLERTSAWVQAKLRSAAADESPDESTS